ncbi:MAG TPA: HEAT repeat domain-containing protein [Myxococcaceae bacterium]|nr:HEAT repeat domain-containing protein [Myxococcaceae bacterium]
MTAATDAATAPDPLADPENRQRLDMAKVFAFQLLKGIKQIGMYRHNEARYTEYLSKAHEAISQYTDRFGPLIFKVEQQNFALFEQPLFAEDTPLPFKFWRDGIRQFIFRPGLRPDELLAFTLVALSDVEKQGEDTVAQLWRSPLDNLEYVVVEGFKVDGFSDEEVQVEVDRIVEYLYSRLRSHSEDFLRFARVTAEDLELKLEGVEQVRGAVISGVTATDELKAKLQKELTEEEQSRLFPKLVSSIFQVAEAGVDDPELLEDMFLQLLDALLLQEDFAIINQIVLKLRAMEDRPGMGGIRRLKATFVEKMGEEQRLVRVADVLRAARPSVLADIGRYLSSLQPTTLPTLLDVLETLDAPEHRLVLCDVIAEFCRANAATPIIQRLSSERPMTVRDMVYVLERAQHPDRMQYFGRVLKHRNLAVRLDVMGTIARGRSVESRRLIAEALKDDNAQVRVQAARLLPEYDREQAYQELVSVMKGKDFKRRSPEEQAAFYTALGSTGLPIALSLMTQLLAERPQLWNRARVLEEKLLAVHGLAGVQSIQSYKALQAVVEDRNQPSEVLVAARRALAETRRKLFGDAAPPEAS